MLYLIGLGLGGPSDITVKGLEIIKKCDRIYLESYTSILGSGKAELEKHYGREIEIANREMVEQGCDIILDGANTQDVAFLVVGDPFGAAAYTDIVLKADPDSVKKRKLYQEANQREQLEEIRAQAELTAVGDDTETPPEEFNIADFPELDEEGNVIDENEATGSVEVDDTGVTEDNLLYNYGAGFDEFGEALDELYSSDSEDEEEEEREEQEIEVNRNANERNDGNDDGGGSSGTGSGDTSSTANGADESHGAGQNGFTGGSFHGLRNSRSSTSTRYGRQEPQRISSPVARAQAAIGKTRSQVGLAQNILQENNNKINEIYRHPGGDKWLNASTPGTGCDSVRRLKQETYRIDLERQVEQSRLRKAFELKKDREGLEHPLGTGYNSHSIYTLSMAVPKPLVKSNSYTSNYLARDTQAQKPPPGPSFKSESDFKYESNACPADFSAKPPPRAAYKMSTESQAQAQRKYSPVPEAQKQISRNSEQYSNTHAPARPHLPPQQIQNFGPPNPYYPPPMPPMYLFSYPYPTPAQAQMRFQDFPPPQLPEQMQQYQYYQQSLFAAQTQEPATISPRANSSLDLQLQHERFYSKTKLRSGLYKWLTRPMSINQILPNEMLEAILLKLPTQDLLNCRSVSKLWKAFASPICRRRFVAAKLRCVFLNDSKIEELYDTFQNTSDLPWSACCLEIPKGQTSSEMLRSLGRDYSLNRKQLKRFTNTFGPNIRKLKLDFDTDNLYLVLAALKEMPNLEILISHMDPPAEDMRIACSWNRLELKKLKHLEIPVCSVADVQLIEFISRKSNNLKSIFIDFQFEFPVRNAAAPGQADLRRLLYSISRIPSIALNISYSGTLELLQTFTVPELKVKQVDFEFPIRDIDDQYYRTLEKFLAVNSNCLEKLKIGDCRGGRSAGPLRIPLLPKLKELVLHLHVVSSAGCHVQRFTSNQFPRLKRMKVIVSGDQGMPIFETAQFDSVQELILRNSFTENPMTTDWNRVFPNFVTLHLKHVTVESYPYIYQKLSQLEHLSLTVHIVSSRIASGIHGCHHLYNGDANSILCQYPKDTKKKNRGTVAQTPSLASLTNLKTLTLNFLGCEIPDSTVHLALLKLHPLDCLTFRNIEISSYVKEKLSDYHGNIEVQPNFTDYWF